MTRLAEIRTMALAYYYRQNPGASAKDMAEAFNMPLGSVYRVLRSAAYDEMLDWLGVHTRHLDKEKTRDPERDDPNLFALAKSIYQLERKNGRLRKKAVSMLLKELPALKRRRVNTWIDKYGWEDECV